MERDTVSCPGKCLNPQPLFFSRPVLYHALPAELLRQLNWLGYVTLPLCSSSVLASVLQRTLLSRLVTSPLPPPPTSHRSPLTPHPSLITPPLPSLTLHLPASPSHHTSQVRTYQEDFQSERRDRERANEQLVRLKEENETLNQIVAVLVSKEGKGQVRARERGGR